MTAESERPTRVRWIIFVLACGTSWFLYLHRYTWNFIGPELKREYGFDNTEISTLYSLFNVTYGIGQVPSGILGDLFGPHLILGVIVVLWSLTLPAFGLTGNSYALGGLRLTFGAAQAGAYPNLTKVTHSWFPVQNRTIVQGWVATFFGRSGGAMSSIIMATVLMGLCGLSWQAALWVMGLAGVAFGAAFLLLFRNSPDVHPRTNEAERQLIQEGTLQVSDAPRVLPFRRAIRSRSMIVFVIQQFLNAGADVVYSAYIGDYFLNAKGFEIASAGLFASLPLWGGAVGGMLGGFCNDWLIRLTGSRRWTRTGVGFTGKFLACLLMFVAIAQVSGQAAAWALFVVKFFSDWSQPTVWGTCTDLGGRYSATVFSIINTSGTLGAIASPLVFGMILDYNTTEQTVNGVLTSVTDYNPLFYTVAGMYILAAVCWILIDSTRSLEREEG